MKVLITGASGQLGSESVAVFRNWEVIATDRDSLDITDKDKIQELFLAEKPDWVIHCAAWTDVEACAADPEKAMTINAEATKNLAQAVEEAGAKMVYISTNEVFDGKKTQPYIEADKTNPINPYAVSKLAGEKYVQEILGEAGVIVRTSWVFGPKGKSNFPLKIIAAADKLGELNVVEDELASPTYAPDLAKAVFELVGRDPNGIYHLVGEGSCSRYEWAEMVLTESGRSSVKINKIKLADYPRKSTPPSFGALANTRAKDLGVVLPSWKQGLEEFFSVRADLIK